MSFFTKGILSLLLPNPDSLGQRGALLDAPWLGIWPAKPHLPPAASAFPAISPHLGEAPLSLPLPQQGPPYFP